MKILKFRLHPGMNKIPVGLDYLAKLVYLNDQSGKLMGWVQFRPTPGVPESEYEVYVALTGEQVPDEYQYITSHQISEGGGYFVVHAHD